MEIIQCLVQSKPSLKVINIRYDVLGFAVCWCSAVGFTDMPFVLRRRWAAYVVSAPFTAGEESPVRRIQFQSAGLQSTRLYCPLHLGPRVPICFLGQHFVTQVPSAGPARGPSGVGTDPLMNRRLPNHSLGRERYLETSPVDLGRSLCLCLNEGRGEGKSGLGSWDSTSEGSAHQLLATGP